MIVHEDGSVTGSIDHAALAQVEPKSDEARAQIEQIQRDQQAGAAQADADAARLAEVHAAQSPWAFPVEDNRDLQGKSVGAPGAGEQQSGTQKTQDAGPAATSTAPEPPKDTASESAKDTGSSGGSGRRASREG